MGGLPISITLDMLSFQLNSIEVQVIKAGAYCVHPPCAANDTMKYSWRGKPVMISVKNVSFIFFPFFTTKHTISPQPSLQLSKAERTCGLKEDELHENDQQKAKTKAGLVPTEPRQRSHAHLSAEYPTSATLHTIYTVLYSYSSQAFHTH